MLRLAQPDSEGLALSVRMTTEEPALSETKGLRACPAFDVKALDEQVDESLLQERFVASLSILFGVLALLVTCVGLYGLIAYSRN